MRKVYGVLAYLLAAEVVIQAMAIAYALAGLGKWVEDDGGVLNKAVLDSDNGPDFRGIGGFATHGINGMMIIPLLVLLLLIISFFAKLPGASKRAAVLLGLVVLQVILGIALHSVPYIAWLHVLNAFAIFMGALMTGRWAFTEAAAPASEPVAAA
jgi:hypothetical protein